MGHKSICWQNIPFFTGNNQTKSHKFYCCKKTKKNLQRFIAENECKRRGDDFASILLFPWYLSGPVDACCDKFDVKRCFLGFFLVFPEVVFAKNSLCKLNFSCFLFGRAFG